MPLDVQGKEHPVWLAPTVEKVHELTGLPEGWDGHGSRRIQPASVANMLWILDAVAHADVPSPHIAPISGGALQVEWPWEGRDLEIVTHSDGSIHYLQADGGDADLDDMRDGVLSPDDDVALHRLLDWLL